MKVTSKPKRVIELCDFKVKYLKAKSNQVEYLTQQFLRCRNPSRLTLAFTGTYNAVMSPLLDKFGRVHTNLRISVTDRCNIRCFYCMPNELVQFKPRDEILTFEEIVRFVSVVATAGVDKLRLTGGEPLLRAELPELIRQLRSIPGIRDIALTTNGILLDKHAGELKAAGLDRLNVSLDTLDEEIFEKIVRRKGLHRVLDGIRVAKQTGFEQIRLNAIAIKDLTESEIIPLVEFAIEQNMHLRFIEFMPLDADQNWTLDDVLTGESIRTIIEQQFGELQPALRIDSSQPATDFEFADENAPRAKVGFINSVSEPFCGACNRLRLTAEGGVRNCLFSEEEWNVRSLIRSGTDQQILDLVRASLSEKKRGHGRDDLDFLRPSKAMYQIGG